MNDHNNENLNLNNQDGQSFIEFILLLVMLVGISFGLLAGINGGIAKRWKAIVTIIVTPTDTDLTLLGE